MARISRIQEDYRQAYEDLAKTGINADGFLMLAESSYDEKVRLVEYKDDEQKRSKNYDKEMSSWCSNMLRVFFRLDTDTGIYNNFKSIYSRVYLINKDEVTEEYDETNDYKDKTMIKLNKIYSFINDNEVEEQDLTGTELLSLIRIEVNQKGFLFKDDYFDISYEKLKKKSKKIREATPEEKQEMLDEFLLDVADMETYLFKRKLFYHDYRKCVTGVVNCLFARAGIPEIYIKPVDLDDYYSYVLGNKSDLVTFYKEKICDSLNDAFVEPMKKVSKYSFETDVKKEVDLNSPTIDLRLN